MKDVLRRSSVTLSAMAFSVSPAVAQRLCTLSAPAILPGAPFGITNYTCASCGMATVRDSAHVVYSFATEPVVFGTEAGSPVRPGDVIVAVNGAPITSRAGGDRFAYPPDGELQLTVRRGGANLELHMVRPRTVVLRPSPSAPTLDYNARPSLVPTRGDSAATGSCDGFVERGEFPATYNGLVASGGRGGRGGARVGGGGAGGAGGMSGSGAAAGGRGGSRVDIPITASALGNPASTCMSRASRLVDTTARRVGLEACDDSSRQGLFPRPTAVARGGGAIGGGAGGTASLGALAGGGGGANQLLDGPRQAMSSISATSAQLDIKNFGLVLECRPACRRTRAADGTTYLQFDGYPAVVTPIAGSVAARAGLHDGDIVVTVHNLSPLTEEGALLLNHAERVLTLDLEISRGGKREKITLKL